MSGEAAGIFPAKTYSQAWEAGFLGAVKPVVRGLGLEYSYGVLMAEVLGEMSAAAGDGHRGATDMANAGLAKFGSDRVRLGVSDTLLTARRRSPVLGFGNQLQDPT